MKKLVKENMTEVRAHQYSHSGSMTINEFSEIMSTFYDSINEVEEFLDDHTISMLLNAKIFLNRAWKNEAYAHGVRFSPYKFLGESVNEDSKIDENENDDSIDWHNDVFDYLTTDYEMDEEEAVTFMVIVDEELENLFNTGISASDAAGTIFANEDALSELESYKDNDEEDEED